MAYSPTMASHVVTLISNFVYRPHSFMSAKLNIMDKLHEKNTRAKAITVDTIMTTINYEAYENIVDAESPISSVLFHHY